MKRFLIVFLLFFANYQLFAQIDSSMIQEKRASLTIGFLQGGGSLIGGDFEALLSDKVGIQLGAGLSGYGAGVNYHFKPSIRSSFLSLMYWHQGFGSTYAQSLIGPNYVFRGKKWFTAQIGLGYVIGYGPAWSSSMAKSTVILTYAIGAYFPL